MSDRLDQIRRAVGTALMVLYVAVIGFAVWVMICGAIERRQAERTSVRGHAPGLLVAKGVHAGEKVVAAVIAPVDDDCHPVEEIRVKLLDLAGCNEAPGTAHEVKAIGSGVIAKNIRAFKLRFFAQGHSVFPVPRLRILVAPEPEGHEQDNDRDGAARSHGLGRLALCRA